MAFLEGFVLGLSMIIFIGPVLFTLLQAALQFGFKSGWAVAWGIIISDIICVILSKMGAAVLLQNKSYVWYIGISGAVLLTGMGLNYLLNPNLSKKNEVEIKRSDYIGYFIKGFLVNFVNPFVFLVWIGVCTRALTQYGNYQGNIYLSGALLGIFATDTLKAVFAEKLRKVLTPAHLSYIYKIVGGMLILFAVILGIRIYWY
ncbi:MAG: LysE family transporter [Bacteroidia bacterium]|nr:LysE family transporter [Bacteroidia bacterium]